MKWLDSKGHPGERPEVGDMLLLRARGGGTELVKRQLGEFARVHRRYLALEAAVAAAEREYRAALAKLAERDVEQDAAVQHLAAALAGAGVERKNPFRGFGVGAVWDVIRLGYVKEAKVVARIVREVRKRRLGKGVEEAAKGAERAAKEVVRAAGVIEGLEERRKGAYRERDAMGLPWERAFAVVRRAARSAEFEGAEGLTRRLFGK